MKKHLSAKLLSAALAATVMLQCAGAAMAETTAPEVPTVDASNSLKYDFEDKVNPGNDAFTVTEAPNKAHGNYSIKANMGDALTQWNILVNLTYGKTYEISYYTYICSESTEPWSQFLIADNGGNSVFDDGGVYRDKTQHEKWILVAHSFTATATGRYSLCFKASAGMSAYYDDIKVKIATSCKINTPVAVYSFEDQVNPVNGDLKVTEAPDALHGSYSLKREETGDDIDWTLDVNLTAGKTYRISYYSYFIKESKVPWHQFLISKDGQFKFTPDGIYLAENLRDQWVLKTYLFTADETGKYVLNFKVGNSIAYFDDISVREYDYLYVNADFSNKLCQNDNYITVGSDFVSFGYQKDAETGETYANAVFKASNFDDEQRALKIPYQLKAGKEYSLKLNYTVTNTIALVYNLSGSVAEWLWNGREEIIFKPEVDSYLYIATNNGNDLGINLYGYTLKEVIDVTAINDADAQLYDFDMITPEKYWDQSYDLTETVVGSDGMVTNAVCLDTTNAETFKQIFKLNNAIEGNTVYKLTYDFKGEANLRILPSWNGWWGDKNNMFSADKTVAMDNNRYLKADEWTIYSTYFMSPELGEITAGGSVYDGKVDYITLYAAQKEREDANTVKSKLYIDNIKLEKVTVIDGDLDGDGKFSSADLIALKKVLIGIDTGNNIIDWASDANSNGVTDVCDFIRLKKLIADSAN